MHINLHLSKYLNLSELIDFTLPSNLERVKEAILDSHGKYQIYKQQEDLEYNHKLEYTCDVHPSDQGKGTTEQEAIIDWVLKRCRCKGLKPGGYGNPLAEQQELIKLLKETVWIIQPKQIIQDLTQEQSQMYINKINDLDTIIAKLEAQAITDGKHLEYCRVKMESIQKLTM